MARVILLDSAPLGRISHPDPELEMTRWVDRMVDEGTLIAMPEIADYEVRRELLRAGKTRSVRQLDLVRESLQFLEIKPGVMPLAAQLWAAARRRGRPGAPPYDLDADVIIAAQALILQNQGHDVVVATDNPRHFELFV